MEMVRESRLEVYLSEILQSCSTCSCAGVGDELMTPPPMVSSNSKSLQFGDILMILGSVQ